MLSSQGIASSLVPFQMISLTLQSCLSCSDFAEFRNPKEPGIQPTLAPSSYQNFYNWSCSRPKCFRFRAQFGEDRLVLFIGLTYVVLTYATHPLGRLAKFGAR